MKNIIRSSTVLVLIAILLGSCVNPISWLTDVTPSRPTPLPQPDRTITPSGPISDPAQPDTTGLIRDPVTAADRTGENLVETSDIPIADLRQLAIRFQGVPADTPLANCTAAPTYNLGDMEQLNVQNSNTLENFVVTATLIAKSDQAYMWLDNHWLELVNHAALKRALQIFGDQIIPRDHALFGEEKSPGIDCDPRLHILNTSNTDAGGYFSSVDQVTRAVRPDSNEKDMFYVDIEGSGGPDIVGTGYYIGTLAHEFQHMIQENHDKNEDTWINEGLSNLAMYLNGYDDGNDTIAAQVPDVQLNMWPDGGVAGHENYGTAYSFALYFWDSYGDAGVQALAAEPANGLTGIQNVLNQIDSGKPVDELVSDWMVARLLDDPQIADGRYGYRQTDRTKVQPRQTIGRYPFSESARIHQYAADYTEFTGGHDLTLDFAGSTKAQLIDAQPHSGQYFMWSNRGDMADLQLTRDFDLTGVKDATLKFWIWYDLEKDWDYGYVSVSTDGGQTWQLLKSPSMTDSNPTESNYGWGYTGKSGDDPAQWVQESIDLTPYAGQKIRVAFDVINDMAVNRPGMAIDDVEVPEINYTEDFETGAGGWQPQGWLRTNNFVPQRYVVQLVSHGRDGNVTVSRLPVNEDNTARWDIPLSQLNKAILVVSPMALKTTEVARYNWSAQEK